MTRTALASAVADAETITVEEDDGSEWVGVVLPIEIRAELIEVLRALDPTC
jgi:hypothetical protein